MKVKLKDRSNLLVINYHYEVCYLKRKVSAPKRPKDSKAWCPLSFSFEIL